MTKKINKIEKYIRLDKKAKDLRKEHKIAEAYPYRKQIEELDKTYTMEDLVADFDSIGWKVDIEAVTKELIRAKKIYEKNNRKFDNFAIGVLLLGNFADAYAERRGM